MVNLASGALAVEEYHFDIRSQFIMGPLEALNWFTGDYWVFLLEP